MANLTPEVIAPTPLVEEPVQAVDIGLLEQTTNQTSRSRRKWSTDENKDVLMCFFKAKTEGKYFGKRMNELWIEKHPDINVGEKRLTLQKNMIIKKKWFTDVELDQIKYQATKELTEVNDEHPLDIQNIENDTVSDDHDGDTIIHDEQHIEQEHSLNDLSEYQMESRQKIIDTMNNTEQRKRLPKLKYSVKLTKITADVNKVMDSIPTRSITETNKLLYTTGLVVTGELGYKMNERKRNNDKYPPWKRRIQNRINNMRKDISRLKELDAKNLKNKRLENVLTNKYQLNNKSIKQVIEELKQHVKALGKKIERYDNRIKHYHQNKMFQTNQKDLYKELNETTKTKTNAKPNKDEVRTFWSDLWSKEKHHNTNAQWLKDVQQEYDDVREQQDLIFTREKVKKMAKKIKNWKAPGKDEVHGYWIKHLTNLHERIAAQLQHVFESDETPPWMTEGRTTLIMKDEKKGPIPSNYRPITCLPTLWKLMTSIISDSIYQHLDEQGLMPKEQKGCSRGSRGTKDQLLIDKTILRNAKLKKKNLEMIWIDYKKAYDSVPHSWILESLSTIKVNASINKFLRKAMKMWRTELMVEKESCGLCDIKSGIFQGDSLSPLLFIVALIPLSTILNNTNKGYKIKCNQILNHLLYMDDLKLYAKTERESESLLHTVRIFSEDISMTFGIEKCAKISVKRGKVVRREGIKLPDGKEIKCLQGEENYKYLGVLEKDDINHDKVKKNVRTEYTRRLKLILKSKLNGRNKIVAINTYAIPVVRYTAGIVKWNMEEVKEMDRKTRKQMTIHRGLHPRADVDRLYLPRSNGGRGLKSIEDVVHEEEIALNEYVKKNEYLSDIIKDTPDIIKEHSETKKEYHQRKQHERMQAYKNKPLHGQYIRNIEGKIDIESTNKWLNKGDLKIETEGLITAAQDQSLPVKALNNIYKNNESPLCRLCKEKTETVEHIVSGCKVLAGNEYKQRHDNVARNIHWHICEKNGIECEDKWWKHQPKAVEENDDVKILWDFNIYTDKKISARRPDIVVIDKKNKRVQIIDISVPADHRIQEKENEKVNKYQDLRIEIERLWEMKTTTVPVVIGSLGAIPAQLKEQLKRLGIKCCNIANIQKSVLLGTAHIIRKVLQLSGSG